MRTPSKTPNKNARARGAEVGVADERTERSASAIAHSWRPIKSGKGFEVREVQLSIIAGYGQGITPQTPAFVEFTITVAGKEPEKYSRQRIYFENAQLVDLPLIALALQAAVRIGVEQGAFPDLSGSAVL